MKKATLLILLLSLIMVFISCDNSPQFGSIKINVEKDVKARTIEPNEDEIKCSKYKIVYYPEGDSTSKHEKEITTNEDKIDNLIIGDWIFKVEGYNENNILIAESEEVKINIKVNEVVTQNFQLEYCKGGEGKLNLTFKIDKSGNIVDKIVVTFEHLDSSNQSTLPNDITITKADSESDNDFIIFSSQNNISTGDYRINASFYSNGERINSLTNEIVHIYKGLDSSYSDEFRVTASKPEIKLLDTDGYKFRVDSKVELSSKTDNAIIYYTLDDSDPLTSNTKKRYVEPFTLDNSLTVRAVATKENLYPSTISENYITVMLRTPTLSLEAGRYNESKKVTISADDGATIRYTINDVEKSALSNVEIEITENTTISNIYAVKEKCFTSSSIDSKVYNLQVPNVTFSINDNSYNSDKTLTFKANQTLRLSTIDGATIMYSIDGSEYKDYTPNTDITIDKANTTIRAYATKPKWMDSNPVSHEYKIESSANITIKDPSHYTLTLTLPEGWSSGTTVVPGVYEVIIATLDKDNQNATYTWYLDGVVQPSFTTKELTLGSSHGQVYLYPGIHIIKCEAKVDSRVYSAEYRVSVAENGIGTPLKLVETASGTLIPEDLIGEWIYVGYFDGNNYIEKNYDTTRDVWYFDIYKYDSNGVFTRNDVCYKQTSYFADFSKLELTSKYKYNNNLIVYYDYTTFAAGMSPCYMRIYDDYKDLGVKKVDGAYKLYDPYDRDELIGDFVKNDNKYIFSREYRGHVDEIEVEEINDTTIKYTQKEYDDGVLYSIFTCEATVGDDNIYRFTTYTLNEYDYDLSIKRDENGDLIWGDCKYTSPEKFKAKYKLQ